LGFFLIKFFLTVVLALYCIDLPFMKRKMQVLGFFAFMALMFVKVSALHVYAHHDYEGHEVEDCTSCELAMENQSVEVLLDFSEELVLQQFFSYPEPTQLKELCDFSNTSKNLHLFLRPPPSL
jgi:hypothetical protein